MTDSDIKTGKELLNEEYIQKNPLWAKVCVGVGVQASSPLSISHGNTSPLTYCHGAGVGADD